MSTMSVIDLIKLICLDGYELLIESEYLEKSLVSYIKFSKQGPELYFNDGHCWINLTDANLTIDKHRPNQICVQLEDTSHTLTLKRVETVCIKELLESI